MRRRFRVVAALGSGLLLLFGPFTGSGAAADGNLPGGTAISVEVDSPADGALVASPPGGFTVTGTASVGEGVVLKDTTVAYSVDRSGSMGLNAGTDCDGVSGNDTRMRCAQEGVRVANTAAADPSSAVGHTGLAAFGTNGTAHDVDLGAAGTQLVVAPDHDGNTDGDPDLEDVAFGLTPSGQTNYAEGLTSAFSVLNASTNPVNVVFFLSDADSESVMTGPHISTVAGSVPANTTIHAFGMGAGTSCTFDGGTGSMNQIAALSTAGSGTCQVVNDVSQLGDFIAASLESTLDDVSISVDGAAPEPADTTTPVLPQTGPASVGYSHAVTALAPGQHSICAVASGTDAGGEGSVTDCIAVTVADITLTPASETNELGTPGQEHTVTATVAAGGDGGVSDVSVDFDILSGPNTGVTDSGTTDVAGQATFTYPATQGPAGLGTDTIQSCFTDDLGNEACATATKDWVDTTPPDVDCTPTGNPAGNEPRAGHRSPGQNEDGFYELTASDAVDPDPDIFLRDTGSGTVFGPFQDGTRIKYTEDADATPEQKTIGGPNSGVAWHIIGNGDAAIFAVDDSGNESAPVDCLVPAPPK